MNAFYVLPKPRAVAKKYLPNGTTSSKDINNLISLDNRKLRVTLQSNVTDSKTSNELFNEIKAEAKKRSLSLKLTGKPLFHDLTPYIVSTFLKVSLSLCWDYDYFNYFFPDLLGWVYWHT